MHLEFAQPVGHLCAVACQERGAHTVGDSAKAQVKAGGLDLGGNDRGLARQGTLRNHLFNLLVGNHAGHNIRPSDAQTARTPCRAGRCVVGRASRTRTCDLPSPRRTRYQAAP